MKEVITTTYPNTVSMTIDEYDCFQYMGCDIEVYDKDTKKRLGYFRSRYR